MAIPVVEAQFVRGNPEFGEYTPSGAIAAGEVVVVGDLIGIAHSPIPANELGNLSKGPGVYRMLVGADLAPGQAVSWNNTSNRLVAADAAGTHKFFGFLGMNWNPTAADQYVEAHFDPGYFLNT